VEGKHDGKNVTAVVALAQKRVTVQGTKAPERIGRGARLLSWALVDSVLVIAGMSDITSMSLITYGVTGQQLNVAARADRRRFP
jgi:hypothetical protein